MNLLMKVIKLKLLDVDENLELAQQYQIQSVPTIVIEEGDQVVDGVIRNNLKRRLITEIVLVGDVFKKLSCNAKQVIVDKKV